MLDVVRAALRPRKRAMSAAEELEQLEDARSKCNARCIEVREQLEAMRAARRDVLIEGPDKRLAEHDAEIQQLERQERDALTLREELDRRIRKLAPIVKVEVAIAAVPDLQPMLGRVEKAEAQLREAIAELRGAAQTVLAGYRAAESAGRLGELPEFSDEQCERIERLASRYVTGPNPHPGSFSLFEFRPPRARSKSSKQLHWTPDGVSYEGGPWTEDEKREAARAIGPQPMRYQKRNPAIQEMIDEGIIVDS